MFPVPVPRSVQSSLFVVLCSLSLSCGGSGGNNPPGGGTGGGGGSSDGVNVSASTRLAWSQAAPDRATLGGYQFVAYVDGARTPLSDARCGDTPGASGYECTAALPAMTSGRHVLELATIGNGLESARSAQLVVNRLAQQASAAAAEVQFPGAVSDRVCVEGTADDCFDVDVVAEGLTAPDHLALLPRGRAMFVEAGRRASILDLETGAIEPALAAHGDTGRLVGLAVDPAFEDTRFVFVAVVGAQHTLSVMRLREVANRLGEAATLLADVPVAAEGSPAMAMDAARRLVIAMPSSAGDRDAYAGRVLRFTDAGASAGHNAMASPILAAGPSQPTTVAFDGRGRLWVGAADEPAGRAVMVMPQEPGDRGWPSASSFLDIETAAWPEGATGVRDVAFFDGSGSNDGRVYVVIAQPPGLVVGRLDAAGTGINSLRPLALDREEPKAVAVLPSGDLLVAAGTRILRLRRPEAGSPAKDPLKR